MINGRKLALDLIKKEKINNIYIISSAAMIDPITKEFCETLKENGIKYNLSCLWYEKVVLESIDDIIYPITRSYIEPLEFKPKYIIAINTLGIEKHVFYKLNINPKNIYYFFNDDYYSFNKTPDLIKERRTKYLE